MPTVKVQQGDHITRLTNAAGLGTYDSVWSLAENVNLKKQRENPNVLLPGDEVFVPERQEKQLNAATDMRHKYVKKGSLRLRVIIQDSTGEPFRNATLSLSIHGRLETVQTDGNGLLAHNIPADARAAVLTFFDTDAPFTDPVKIGIGNLDPIDTSTGWIGRLNNLGYFAGSIDPLPPDASQEQKNERDRLLKSAIEEFQCDNRLQVDGICGPKTQHTLKEVYGC
jgi:hypothetical protein